MPLPSSSSLSDGCVSGCSSLLRRLAKVMSSRVAVSLRSMLNAFGVPGLP